MTVEITTEEYWEVDGEPLNTWAYNIATLSGRTGTTGLRGEDQEHAYRPGRSFRPKVADSRSISLVMWVQGSDPTQVGSGSDNPSSQFWSNLQKLQKLFFTPRRQITLTKRWVDADGLHTAYAKGQVMNPINPSHTKHRAVFVVDVFLVDPFFYAVSPTVVNVPAGGSATTDNPGVDSTPNNLQVSFVGPLTDPVLTNTTPTPDIVLSYAGSIDAGATLVVDVPVSRAVLAGALVNNKISYAGSIWPMEVFPGSNSFTLTAASGSGSASISYRPTYF